MADDLNTQKPSFGSQVISYTAFPVAIQGGSAVSAIVRNKGIGNAIAAQKHEGFKKLAGKLDKDVFTKSLQLANEYDAYKGFVKDNAKAAKQLAKATKKAQNATKNAAKNADALTKAAKDAQKAADKAKNVLKDATNAIDDGKSVIEATTGKAAKEAAEAAAKKAGKTGADVTKAGAKALKEASEVSVKGVMKKELASKMNIGFAALFTFLPTFKDNAIPAFKNEGFKAGMKETLKALGFAGADLGLSAVATAIGGAVGGAIGSIFCPGVGTRVGSTIGSGVASAVVSSKIATAAEKAGKYTGAKTQETQLAQTQQNKQFDMQF